MVGSVSRLTTAVHSLGIRAIGSGSTVGRSSASKLGVSTFGIGVTWLGRLMGWENASEVQALCTANCSHGECYNGTCFCEVSRWRRHIAQLIIPRCQRSGAGSIRRGGMQRAQHRIPRRIRQCLPPRRRYFLDTAVHLYPRGICSAEDALVPQSMPHH